MDRKAERVKELLTYLGILVVLYLFYKSFLVFILLLPCTAVYRRIHRNDMEQKRRFQLNIQFKDMLDSLSAALRAGYSVENALNECYAEMIALHGEDSPIAGELNQMIRQIQMGIRAEEAFSDFAARSRVQDIETFSSVFSIAKRTGGDLTRIIQRTTEEIAQRVDTKNEIAVLISAKRLEQRIMALIPAGIILYIDMTSDGLLEPLYGNPAGIMVMTVCFLIYAAAVLLGKRIVQIEV